MSALTTHDSTVLKTLFDSESAPSVSVTIDDSLPPYPEINRVTASGTGIGTGIDSPGLNTSQTLQSLQRREVEIINRLAPHIQQTGSDSSNNISAEAIKSAILDLDSLISEYPFYPSAYVNRAQALRMLVDSDSSQTTAEHDGTNSASDTTTATTTVAADLHLLNPKKNDIVSRLFDDLGQAIALSTLGVRTGDTTPNRVSPTQARILADAHTHRGYLLLKASRLKKETLEVDKFVSAEDDTEVDLPLILNRAPQKLEEMASRDFFLGGRYGNRVAGSLAVRTNPYAKMCGDIVKGALKKEMGKEDVKKDR